MWFLNGECCILNYVKEHCGKPSFKLTSCFLQLHVFEKRCGDRVESAIIPNSVTLHCGETIFELTFCFTQKCLKTYAGTARNVSDTHLCQSVLWENHLSTNVWYH